MLPASLGAPRVCLIGKVRYLDTCTGSTATLEICCAALQGIDPSARSESNPVLILPLRNRTKTYHSCPARRLRGPLMMAALAAESAVAPKLALTYLDIKGVAEPIRLVGPAYLSTVIATLLVAAAAVPLAAAATIL